MPISVDKSGVLHYGAFNLGHTYACGEHEMPNIMQFKDLGVIRTADGRYSEHISNMVQKARRLVGATVRGIQSRDPSLLLRVFTTYIKPILMYASPIWNPSRIREATAIESVQRRFTKRLRGFKDMPYGDRLQQLGILSLESSRLEADMITVYKLMHGLIGIKLKEAGLQMCCNNTRGGGLRLRPLVAHNMAAAAMFKYRVPTVWNSLPLSVVSCSSLVTFKSALRRWLSDMDFIYYN